MTDLEGLVRQLLNFATANTCRGLAHWRNWKTSSCCRRSTRATRGASSELVFLVFRRRLAFNRQRYKRFATDHNQPKRSFFLPFFPSLSFLRKATEFLTIAKNYIHMLIKSHELSNKLPAILECSSHPVIHILQDFAALCHTLRHGYEYLFVTAD